VHDEATGPEERVDPQEPLQGEHIHQRVHKPSQAALGTGEKGEVGWGRLLLPPPINPVGQSTEENGNSNIGSNVVK